MKHTIKRVATAALALTLAAGLMTGCATSGGKGSKTSDGDKVVFSYDGTDVTLKEAWIYAKMTGAQYDASYSSYFGTDFWTMDMGTDDDGNAITFEEYVKEQVVTQIKKVIVLDNKADELGCSLNDEDKKQCEEYAKAFADDDSGAAILKECGATQDDIQKIYEDNALASKIQEAMVEDTDTDVSDDEARETTIYRVVFATTTTDDDGQTVDMTAKEKKKVLKKAKKALKKIQSGTDIEDIASDQEYTDTDETFASGESDEGEAFEKVLAGMKDGDVVSEVQECENGYVIAKLVAYTDEDATATNKESIIEERQQETFSEKYDEWTEDLEKDWDYDTAVDQELWAQVILRSEDSTATEAVEETTEAATSDGDLIVETSTQAAETDTAAEASTTAQ